MGKSSLGPGFRFKPTDVELLQYYLKRKIMGRKLHSKVIAELDIYKYEPWDLPDKSSCDSGDLKWYFFCPREKKYSNGNRIKRATEGGYWKTTGKDRSVVYCGQVSGWIKTLVFHTGKPPRGDRTDWVMHEYRLENQALADKGVPLDSYVLCMFFQKEGLGPRNGAQYGVPFKEEDWSDDEVEISSEAVQESNIAEPDLRLPCNYNNLIATNMHSPEDIGTYPSSGSCIFDILPLSSMVPKPDSSNYLSQKKPHTFDVNDIQSMEENTFFTNGNGKSKYICLDAVPNANMPEPDLILPNDYAIRTHISECIGASPPELSTSVVVQPPCNFLQPDTGSYVTTEKPHDSHGDDILMMLNCFTEKSAFRMPEVDNNEDDGWFESFPKRNMPEPNPALANNCDNFIAACGRSQEAMDLGPSFEAWRFDGLPPSFDTSDVCENLADSGNLTSFGEVGNLSGAPDDYLKDFLELGDLDQPQHPSLFF